MQALQMSMAFILPSVFFSGFIFPRETMPAIFYGIGAVMPTTYFIELMRAIILAGRDVPRILAVPCHHDGNVDRAVLRCALRFRTKIG
jgi:ABC-2 type transport system permease protein